MLITVVEVTFFWRNIMLCTVKKSHHGDQSSMGIMWSQKGKMSREEGKEASIQHRQPVLVI